MRITTWNCNTSPNIKLAETAVKSYHAKEQRISMLGSDITVLQEVSNPHTSNSAHSIWHGVMMSRGIAVLTSPAYTIEPLPSVPPSRSLVPLQIKGPTHFLLLAVWSCPENPSIRSYFEEVYDNLERYRGVISLWPTVIVGDFNSNSRWDKQVGEINHSYLVETLESIYGLKSCYHSYFGVQQGQEHDGTFYSYRHVDKPFHIDYCFVPAEWSIEKVTVGTHAEWSNQSDHCPLTVDIAHP